MTCKYIDLSSTPYDATTVKDEYDESGCQGVGDHFSSNPIGGGDCMEVSGSAYHIVGVKVLCEDSEVYSNGSPGSGSPDHTHSYPNSPVTIQFWLSSMPSEDLNSCTGYP